MLSSTQGSLKKLIYNIYNTHDPLQRKLNFIAASLFFSGCHAIVYYLLLICTIYITSANLYLLFKDICIY